MSELETSALLRWIVAAPLLAAALQGLLIAPLRRPLPMSWTVVIACGGVLASLVLALLSFGRLVTLPRASRLLLDRVDTWMGAGIGPQTFAVDIAFQLDALSAVMCLVVTTVALLVHVYAAGFLRRDPRDDRGFQRFFVYLNLFVAATLCLVLADNLVLLFAGWEIAGLCSFLLIGFWYGDRSHALAARKAFIVDRIGSFGLLLGLVVVFWSLSEAGSPSLTLRGIEASMPKIAEGVLAPAWLGGLEIGLPTAIGGLLLIGACARSAQMPLHVWLPDAMAAPSPVSALVHAATGVTAGVYLVCRLSFLYAEAPGASLAMAWMGGITALLASVVATAQDDIKKVLAWSTMSQVGLMFLAAGCGAYATAMFHLVTHAFFQSALFLAAGAVILATRQEQDIKRLGALRAGMWRTYLVVVCAALALGGFPFFSGFFSGDEILLAVFERRTIPGFSVLFVMALVTVGFTAFYISRWVLLCFHGPTKLPSRVRNDLRDPGATMMVPLITFAALSIIAGVATLPQLWGDLIDIERSDSLRNFLGLVLAPAPFEPSDSGGGWPVIGAALLAAVFGWSIALRLYVQSPETRRRVKEQIPTFQRVVAERLRFDELYQAAILRPLRMLSNRFLFLGLEQRVVERGAVGGAGRLLRSAFESVSRYTQSGLAQTYLAVTVVSALVIAGYLLGGAR